jgi:hypothetical protein
MAMVRYYLRGKEVSKRELGIAVLLLSTYLSITVLSSVKLIGYLWRLMFGEMMRKMRDEMNWRNSGGYNRNDWMENKALLWVAIIGWTVLIVGFLSKKGYILSRGNVIKPIGNENSDEIEIGVSNRGG